MHNYHVDKDEALRQFELKWLLKMYLMFDGNISKMAEAGGLNRGTIYRMMRRCGVTPEDLAQRLEPSKWADFPG